MAYPNSLFAPARPDHDRVLADPWLAASALQKAIRRGQAARALLATSYLVAKQPDRLWRRLVVIALEDIGIVDLRLAREVLAISGRKQWRAEYGGDWAFAADLVIRLCEAPKSRDACDALVIADLHPDLRKLRSAFLDLSASELADILTNGDRPLGERVLAAWLIAGTKRFPALNLPTRLGAFGDLLAIYETMGVPPDVLEIGQMGSTRTNEGHPLSLPLIWLLAATAGETGIDEIEIADTPDIRGWPAYAFDMHTRAGKQAIRLLQSECRDLDNLVGRYLPRDQYELFIGTLVFRLEGENVDRRLCYAGSQELLRASEIAHLTHHGLTETLAYEALSILRDNLGLLHHCRSEVARRYAP